MTRRVPDLAEAESNDRWRDWQANGEDGEGRRVWKRRVVYVVLAAALLVWVFVQLV